MTKGSLFNKTNLAQEFFVFFFTSPYSLFFTGINLDLTWSFSVTGFVLFCSLIYFFEKTFEIHFLFVACYRTCTTDLQ